MKLSDDIVITGNRALAKSYAKINLTLDVLNQLPNGYHSIKTVMQTVNLFDLIIIDKTEKNIRLTTNLKYLPTNNKNLAYAAAELFFAETGISGGAKILIHKNIPVSAGLAGGSGNAAAVLASLNALYNAGLPHEELCSIGAKLGADVPYCLTGGTQLCEGIGDIMTPLPDFPKATVLLVKPPIHISTAKAYGSMKPCDKREITDYSSFLSALDTQNLPELCRTMQNSMERAADSPLIPRIKAQLIEQGAVTSVMSGSGPTVFAIFDDYTKAASAASYFSKEYNEVFLCKTFN